ncbi:conserved Plasmodium protein, unknown function [Plasmodium vinckei vinckei]|uniref:Uncharacterized protein n=1 Tax=Plasmodium vinckei vinckei TaxID=54757 RepID=A0A449BYC6_PLAVN|nr:conserved Plasmodium protein, unknown function [Plasmodium vinckei vinckei]KEG04812.1 hypothetical protein YYE_00387 [Plasmodium vinckei vinckei]VEV58466.1 conserved Plasmodium protein, unknown function [Plasmodium vinckei vinckei]
MSQQKGDEKREEQSDDYFSTISNYFYNLIYGNENNQSLKPDCLDQNIYDDIVEKHKNSVHQIVYNLKLKRGSNFNVPTRFSISQENEQAQGLKELPHMENKIIDNFNSQPNEEDNPESLGDKYDLKKSHKKKKSKKKKKKKFNMLASEAVQPNKPNENEEEKEKETKEMSRQKHSEPIICYEENQINPIIQISEEEKKTPKEEGNNFEDKPIDEIKEKSNENVLRHNKKERKKKKHNNFINLPNNKLTNLDNINQNNQEILKKTKCNTNKKNNDNMAINYILDNNKKFVNIKSNKEKKDDVIKLPKINLISHNKFLSSEEENEKKT